MCAGFVHIIKHTQFLYVPYMLCAYMIKTVCNMNETCMPLIMGTSYNYVCNIKSLG